ncbi:MAG: S41 family peptidase [Dehalococcoidia bacterium]
MAKKIRFSILLLMILAVLFQACDVVQVDSSPEELGLVEQVWKIIHDDYVELDELDDMKLAEAAVKGMVESLGDPYTYYLGKEQTQISSSELEGDFSGIGVTVTKKDDELTVVAPIADSPADKAGVRPGDIIMEVDGESTAGMGLIEATLKIRGEAGTAVTLLILHEGESSPVEIEITRAKIEIPSVKWELVNESIAHITITNFSGRTASEFREALQEVNEQEIDGIVLDVRNNPGGLVSAAVSVVSEFVGDGVVVYSLDNKGKKDEWMVEKGGIALEIPLTVLVNDYTASASEVVAGSLQAHDRAVVIGTTTYGKGKMNLVHDLNNGGSLYVTFAYWYTPDGRQIEQKGIIPDVRVEAQPDGEDDAWLQQAVQYLKEL